MAQILSPGLVTGDLVVRRHIGEPAQKEKRPPRQGAPSGPGASGYWQRRSASSIAAVNPRKLKVSTVCVPRPERAVITAVVPARIAASSAASSSALPGQAHSPSVKSW
jgi:hypothetical protein